jgi:hypothetical protein
MGRRIMQMILPAPNRKSTALDNKLHEDKDMPMKK